MENRSTGGNGEAGVWRAVDAAANRAAEAIRVVEDVARFVLDDPRSTAAARDVRHELAAILACEPLRHRVTLRDVAGDVGLGMRSAHALRRGSAADLVAANSARAGQALRSLEECAAVVAPDAAPRFERLRYRVYELERGGLAVARARERLSGIDLCVLVYGRRDEADFARLVGSLVEAGVRMLQIRDKGLGVPALVERVRRALGIVRSRDGDDRALVVVNDRADVAAALGAAGVHTGADDMPTALVRRVVGPSALVGRTAHDVAEARAAVADGADYLGVGPCFPSPTKSFATQAPPEFLRTVAGEVALPVYAIGGVTLERLDALAALGIHRVAVASAVTAAADPAAAAAAFLSRLAKLRG
ncbi:MAG: thiamine phosphate synthase [Planctomycetaceae bacterium]